MREKRECPQQPAPFCLSLSLLDSLTLDVQVVQAGQLRLQAVGGRVDHVVAVLWRGKRERGERG